jgi:hypothetical protein
MRGASNVAVYVPEAESFTEQLVYLSDKHCFGRRRFPFTRVAKQKFTSQLKCQGFLHILSELEENESVLFVDADTFCLSRFEFDARTLDEVRNGRIGLVADIKNWRTELPKGWWSLGAGQGVPYVNTGVMLAGKQAIALFACFADLAKNPRYLTGPFNDQSIVNFALANHFPNSLVLLDKRFNGMADSRDGNTVIGHYSGGAGHYVDRQMGHLAVCARLIGDEFMKEDEYDELIRDPTGFLSL